MGVVVVASRYELGDVLGRGGMGEVYRAIDTTTGHPVAIKVMSADRAGSAEKVREWEVRFDREVKAISGLRSPHVVQILDAGVDPETRARYLVMELLEGEDLAKMIRRLGPLPVDVALRIGAQICMGLAQAHAQGIVHRDIKPANVFLGRQGNVRTARILDFGVARLIGAEEAETTDVTRTGSMVGSPQYMSPEQARGSKGVDVRADIWSVGIVLYKMLSGTLPHEMGADGGFGELLISICFTPAPPIQSRAPWIPPAVAELVARALSIPREGRFESAHEMAAALMALIPGASTELTETLFVPMAPQARSHVAPKAELPSVPTGLTNGAMSRPVDMPGRRSPMGIIAVVTALVGISALATALVLWNARAHANRANAEKAATAASVSVAAPVVPAPTPTPVIPQDLTATVTVPPNATVEIDGVSKSNVGGHVTTSGAAGTTHVVKITNGKQQKTTSIVITADGQAQPSSLAFTASPNASANPDKAAPPKNPDTSTTDSRF